VRVSVGMTVEDREGGGMYLFLKQMSWAPSPQRWLLALKW